MHAWLTGLLALASTGPHPAAGQSADTSRSIEVTGYDTTVERPGEEAPVAILCDPVKFRLSIRLADADSLDRSYPARMTIDPETLSQPVPNYTGEMQYRGRLIRYVQCGPYSIRLTGDFYNANVQGELGAYPAFATVEVFAFNSMLIPNDGRSPVAIGECKRDNRRAPDCPANWAARLDLDYAARREKVVVHEQAVSVRFLSDNSAEGRGRTERRYEVDAPLGLWAELGPAAKPQAKGTP